MKNWKYFERKKAGILPSVELLFLHEQSALYVKEAVMPLTIRFPYVNKYYYICRFNFVLLCHHHHVPEGLGVFPVP